MSGSRRGGEEIRAEQEVVLCGGTIESPKLLLLSGIGPADELARTGVEVALDLPGVGENLHDHLLSPVVCSSARPMPPAVPGTTPLHAHWFAHSRGGLPAADTQPLVFHVPAYLPGMEGPEDGFTLMAGMIRPQSRGRLTLASADPETAPLVDPAIPAGAGRPRCADLVDRAGPRGRAVAGAARVARGGALSRPRRR